MHAWRVVSLCSRAGCHISNFGEHVILLGKNFTNYVTYLKFDYIKDVRSNLHCLSKTGSVKIMVKVVCFGIIFSQKYFLLWYGIHLHKTHLDTLILIELHLYPHTFSLTSLPSSFSFGVLGHGGASSNIKWQEQWWQYCTYLRSSSSPISTPLALSISTPSGYVKIRLKSANQK